MTETSDRYRKVAAQLTDRIRDVPEAAWDNTTPCEGWTARDVVRHLGDSAATFLGRAGADMPTLPSVDDDPLASWEAVRDTIQAALDDPALATREFESPMGTMTLEKMVGMFGIGDVLIHTWDLARATGLDEALDAEEVQRLMAVMEPNDEMMRQGTAFGPRVPVADGADPQAKLIAFTGRHP